MSAPSYEWTGGLPVETDSDTFEWSGGLPHINYEVAEAPPPITDTMMLQSTLG